MEAVALIGIEFTHGDAVVGEDFGGQDEGGILEFVEGREFAEGTFCDADNKDDEAKEACQKKDPEDANGFVHSILIVKVGCGLGRRARGIAAKRQSGNKLTFKIGNSRERRVKKWVF